ncbi:hypothetical protein V6Z11_A08G086200 [Gossypium hirsutum]
MEEINVFGSLRSAAIVRVIVYVYVLMISQDELEEYMKTIFGAKLRW